MNYSGCRALKDWEIQAILSAFDGRYAARDRAWFLLGLHTGYRVGELLSLTVGDVWNHQTRTIRDVITVHRSFMKGKNASRSMPVHRDAASALLAWLDSVNFIGTGREYQQPIFSRQRTSHAMSSDQIVLLLRSAAQKAGVSTDRFGSHVLRKSFASSRWDSPFINRDYLKMARLLGHSNPSHTYRYIEFLDDSLTQAVLAA